MIKVLILTQYYPPEIGAPQNRLSDLAVRMSSNGIDVTVLTAMPNYPSMKILPGYRYKLFVSERIQNVKVKRAWIFTNKKKSVFFRLFNYFSFVFTSIIVGLFKIGKQDFIICESPPLFLGISAHVLKIFKRSKMVFNVSDLWPESAEKLGIVKSKFFLGISYKLERFLYKKSYFVSGQTQGIVSNIKSRFPNKKVFWFRNGIDPSLYDPNQIPDNWRTESGFKKNDFILLYAGIIGHAQGLEVVLKAANLLRDYQDIKFAIVGSGPQKKFLLEWVEKESLSNVIFFDIIPREQMLSVLKSCNASVIPLRKLELFKGAIPSKIFEVAAMEKPIILGVEGEAKELFISEGKCGLAFEPENCIMLKNSILQLYNDQEYAKKLGRNGRQYVICNFDRKQIAKEIIELLKVN